MDERHVFVDMCSQISEKLYGKENFNKRTMVANCKKSGVYKEDEEEVDRHIN